jgi:hypothetical protein
MLTEAIGHIVSLDQGNKLAATFGNIGVHIGAITLAKSVKAPDLTQAISPVITIEG